MLKNTKFYVKAFVSIFLSFLVLVGIFYFVLSPIIEHQYVYHPTSQNYTIPDTLKKKASHKFFMNKNGMDIFYWYIQGSNKLPVVVYCHGNSKNASYFLKKMIPVANENNTIYMIDYRGYGNSKGYPDEKGVFQDTSEFINYLNKQGIRDNNIVIWGHSLGGAIAAHVASQRKFKGVILEGTFTSMSSMREFVLSKLSSESTIKSKLQTLIIPMIHLTQRFDTDRIVDLIQGHFLIIHSKADETIPYTMAVTLSEINPDANLILLDKGSHDGFKWQQKEIIKFLKSIR